MVKLRVKLRGAAGGGRARLDLGDDREGGLAACTVAEAAALAAAALGLDDPGGCALSLDGRAPLAGPAGGPAEARGLSLAAAGVRAGDLLWVLAPPGPSAAAAQSTRTPAPAPAAGGQGEAEAAEEDGVGRGGGAAEAMDEAEAAEVPPPQGHGAGDGDALLLPSWLRGGGGAGEPAAGPHGRLALAAVAAMEDAGFRVPAVARAGLEAGGRWPLAQDFRYELPATSGAQAPEAGAEAAARVQVTFSALGGFLTATGKVLGYAPRGASASAAAR